MTEQYATDIALDADYQPMIGTGGDVLLVSNLDCLLQDIRLEARSVMGDLFYDEEGNYGWQLLDFIHRPLNELDRLELEQRIRDRLRTRPEVIPIKISVTMESEEKIAVGIQFKLAGQDETIQAVIRDALEIEVIPIDTQPYPG